MNIYIVLSYATPHLELDYFPVRVVMAENIKEARESLRQDEFVLSFDDALTLGGESAAIRAGLRPLLNAA